MVVCLSATLLVEVLANPSDSTSVLTNDKYQSKHLSSSIGSTRSFDFNHFESFTSVEDVSFGAATHENSVVDNVHNDIRNKANAVFDVVKSERKYIDFLDETSLLSLPVGIKKTIGNIDYTVIIDSMVVTPMVSYLNAYMVFDLPTNGRRIVFYGSEIEFSKQGGIGIGAKLTLAGDYGVDLGEDTLLVLKGDGGTFVEFDCSGFEKMGISGEVVFSRNMLIPSDTIREERVKGSFATSLTDWNNFLVELELPNFRVNGLDDVDFSVSGAVFDFSDYRNATGASLPADYLANVGFNESPELWRGIYLKNGLVTLPPQFDKKGGGRTSFTARDMIIDAQGFSAHLQAENILQLNEGDLSGWNFSITGLQIGFEANQLIYGGFEGDLIVPVTKDSTKGFEYSTLIYPGSEYVFSITTRDDIDFDLFKTSKVELLPNSSLEIRVAGQRFLPKANLYGSMNIKVKEASLADIRFENLQIQTVSPRIKADYFSFGSEALEQKMGGFPVQINNLALSTPSDSEAALEFDLILNVTKAFSGTTGLAIVGREQGYDRKRWRYKTTKVNSIAIDVSTAAFDFKGSLTFYKNDHVYGDGFNGNVDAKFKAIGVDVSASAIFGNINGFRYWYVDASASLKNGVPIGPGLNLNGIAGGAYSGMKIGGGGANSELGRTASGMIYSPDESAGLGFKASVAFSTPGGGTAFNGNVGLEMAFFKGGGLRYINFKGAGYFMQPPTGGTAKALAAKAKKMMDAIESTTDGLIASDNSSGSVMDDVFALESKDGDGVSAHVFISFDFENSTLHGNFEVYMSVAGGLVRGVGQNNRAGWAVLHFGPDDWYIYIGTPDERIGIQVGLGPIKAQADGYFMVGTSIPGSPPPPKEVSSILGGMDLGYMDDLNALGDGSGFGFGASISVDTGNLGFLIFYARFKAGLGFDIMLKDYGDATCQGSSKPIGINGWYANGQAYAYFDGKIGIKIRVFGKRKKIDILSIGAAAVLQAKLPNPFWMRGIVGGRFKVLGGLVKGNCRFKVTLGKDCKIQQSGSILESVQVIADLTPADGESDVNVFSTPQAVFNLSVETVFEMVDLDNKLKQFKARLDHFTLKSESGEIVGDLEWNSDHNVLVLNPFDILPSKEELVLEAQVSFQEKNGANWISVVVDGKKYVESKSISFKSGKAPDYIPISNVLYSYPMVNQLNFYPEEASNGYIRLKQGQPDLFEPGAEWEQKGRFVANGESKDFDIVYQSSLREVQFTLPDDLPPGQIQAFELVNMPTEESGAIDRNVVTDSTEVGDTGTSVTNRSAEGAIADLQEKNIFETHFRTSDYATFTAKMQAQTITRSSREIAFLWEGLYLSNQVTSQEAFSEEELVGNVYNEYQPAIRLEADLTNTKYVNDMLKPLIYQDYPIGGDIRITHRSTDSLGLIPTKAVRIYQRDKHLTLTESDILAGSYFFDDQGTSFQYLLPITSYYDFSELQAKVAYKYLNQSDVSKRINDLLWGQFPLMGSGSYDMKARYYLPGNSEPNSEVLIRANLSLE